MEIQKSDLAKIAEASGGDLYDADWEGGQWMVEAVITQDSLEDFVEAAKNYHEKSTAEFGTIGGFSFVAFEEVRARKGDQRRPLSVIDFGYARVAVRDYAPDHA